MNTLFNDQDLLKQHVKLANHSMYSKITTVRHLRKMMESHVFAVWDFMSLLKRLQKEITCVQIPWKPSFYPKKLVRFINEIVLNEESDQDENGEANDHFSLYIKAMEEIGAEKDGVINFINDLNFNRLSPAIRNFVQFNLNLCQFGQIHEVASVFFFGREKIIPDMFASILSHLDKNLSSYSRDSFFHLRYYFIRHIQLDGEQHSNLAHECLSILCGNEEKKLFECKNSGMKSLELRSELWNEVELSL